MASLGARICYPLHSDHAFMKTPRICYVPPIKSAAIRRKTCLVRACMSDANAAPHHSNGRSKHQEKLNFLVPNLLIKIDSVLQFAVANFVPLALVSGVLVGLTCPSMGVFAYRCGLSKLTSSGVFLLSGLTLHTGDVAKAIETWPVALFGLASILLITPLAAYLVLQVHVTPREFAKGLALFCCVPTTLSQCVALAQLAGANSVLALALTVTSNLLGVFTMPLMISRLVLDGEGTHIPPGALVGSLVMTLLIPLLVGKVFRDQFSGIAMFVDRKRKQFSHLSSLLLVLVPWMQTSCSRSLLLQVDAASLIFIICLGILVHLLFLAWNTVAMSLLYPYLGRGIKDGKIATTRSIIITASQKTLPVPLVVIGSLEGCLGEAGLLALPCVAMHITQTIIDFILVNYWLRKDASTKIT